MLRLVDPKLLVDADGAAMDRIVGFEHEGAVNAAADQYTMYRDGRPEVVSEGDHSEEARGRVLRKLFTRDSPYHSIFHFLPNGDLEYLDGAHPETSTAEETSFLRAAWRALAGHVRLGKAVRLVHEELVGLPSYEENEDAGYAVRTEHQSTQLLVNNRDNTGEIWGSHLNLLTRRGLEEEDFIDALAAHNLSQIAWAGIGRVVTSYDGRNYRFHLSERADQFWTLASLASTNIRPLVNLRDEPLADKTKYRRIHGITPGETAFSPYVNALRAASTSIILRACELGIDFSDLLPPAYLGAIRIISQDVTLKEAVRLPDGRYYRAVDLQRELGERSFTAADKADYLTPQERLWFERWFNLNDELAVDPRSNEDKLDRVVKQGLVERAVERATKRGRPKLGDIALTNALYYHQLAPEEGYGMRLIRSGHFAESPPEDVLENGLGLPDDTRAKLRGEAIQTFMDAGRDWLADWQHVKLNDVADATVVLNEPYETENERLAMLLERVAA